MALSPDGRYLVTVNAGYGTYESNYDQSLAVLDTQTGKIADFPDRRTPLDAPQTLYSGLAFSRDGRHLYGSMASLTEPTGNGKDAVGNGIVVFSFSAGKLAPERLIPLPLQPLAPGRTTLLDSGKQGTKAIPYPAAIAVIDADGREKLLVADNLADNVVLLDAATGKIEKSFDLSESDTVPRPIPSHSLSQRMISAPLLRCGMLRRLSSSIWSAAKWAAKWRCSSHRAISRREHIPAPLPSRPMAERSMSHWPIAMRLRPWMCRPGDSPSAAISIRRSRGRATLARSRWRWR